MSQGNLNINSQALFRNSVASEDNPVIIRSKLYKAIRDFFYQAGFTEVETPIRIPSPALEDFIDAEPSGLLFLRTSPELHMKRLLQRGMERIFQIGPCFRKGERGTLHCPEFSMLEWYLVDANYLDILQQTRKLLLFVCKKVFGSTKCNYQDMRIDFGSSAEEISVKEAFERFAQQDPISALKEDRFENLLIEKIEPNLGMRSPTFLIDYPIQCAGLSRKKKTNPEIAERWELYLGGLEIANAYSELTDAEDQLNRFEKCAQARAKRNQEIYPIDFEFISALKKGMPECAGCALGLDRLLMILTNSTSISQVRPF